MYQLWDGIYGHVIVRRADPSKSYPSSQLLSCCNDIITYPATLRMVQGDANDIVM